MTPEEQVAAGVEKALRGFGLTDRPDLHDSSIHGWRCEHPDRYEHCDCFAEVVADVTAEVVKALGLRQETYLRSGNRGYIVRLVTDWREVES